MTLASYLRMSTFFSPVNSEKELFCRGAVKIEIGFMKFGVQCLALEAMRMIYATTIIIIIITLSTGLL